MSKDGIFLRELERGDLSTINAWRADRSLVSLLGGNFRHVGREIDDKWFDAYLGSRANNVRLAVCIASSGALIGVTYLLGIDWLNRSAEFSIQIGAESARPGNGRSRGALDTRACVHRPQSASRFSGRAGRQCAQSPSTRSWAFAPKACTDKPFSKTASTSMSFPWLCFPPISPSHLPRPLAIKQ